MFKVRSIPRSHFPAMDSSQDKIDALKDKVGDAAEAAQNQASDAADTAKEKAADVAEAAGAAAENVKVASSSTFCAAGTVLMGASSTSLIVTVVVPTLLLSVPSLATNVIERSVRFGSCELLS